MEKQKDFIMMGVEHETYQQLQEIAKKENKSVVDLVSETLKKQIADSKNLGESKSEKRLLCEG